MSIALYGAYGYTGELIAERAASQGKPLTLAGRDGEKLAALGKQTGLPTVVASLDDPAALDALLIQHDVVLHCAGPFHRTSAPMLEACLRTRTHYLDITGEIPVFEALRMADKRARAKEIMILPGVGFDVVPSDCLAAYLKQELPSATHLDLAFKASGRFSHGTATTMIEHLGEGSVVRRNHDLQREPVATHAVEADFGDGPETAYSIPWGDVSTAYVSTGIPNITTHIALPAVAAKRMQSLARWRRVLRAGPLQALMKAWVNRQPRGPSAEERNRGSVIVWGRAWDESGKSAAARLVGPEGYSFTATAALHIASLVDAGTVKPGFQTPSSLLGADFILTLDGVSRTRLP